MPTFVDNNTYPTMFKKRKCSTLNQRLNLHLVQTLDRHNYTLLLEQTRAT